MNAKPLLDGDISNRELLIDTALALFAERGFRGVSISELARSCGVAKSTVLHHFSNKSHLYSHVLDRIDHELEQLAALLTKTPGNHRDNIRRMIASLLEWACTQPQQACLVVFELLELRSSERKPTHWNLAPSVKVLLQLIKDAQSAGVVYDNEAAAILELILGATTYGVLSEPVTAAIVGQAYDHRFAERLNTDIITLLERAIIKPENIPDEPQEASNAI